MKYMKESNYRCDMREKRVLKIIEWWSNNKNKWEKIERNIIERDKREKRKNENK